MTTSSSRSAILLCICMAHFVNPFMMSSVAVALPTIGREMGASALQLGLVEAAFLLSAVASLLALGRIGDIYGRRRVFQSGLLVFAGAGGAIALVNSIELIILLRFIQGLGGAMINATSMAILVAAYPKEERGRVLGITVGCVYAGISCGPFIGGLLIEFIGWRSLFIITMLLGVLTWVVTRIKIREEWIGAEGESFDWKGLALYAPSVMALVYAGSNLNDGIAMQVLALVALCGLGGFWYVEKHSPSPLLDVRLLEKNRVFALSNLAALLNYSATFGVTFFLSLFLQTVKGMTPYQAGTLMIIQPLVQTVFSPLCGRLSDRISPALLATAGMSSCALGLALASFLRVDSSLPQVALLLIFFGLGFALFSSPNTSMIMGSVGFKQLGVASGLSASMRSMGMLVSMTIITLTFAQLMPGQAVGAETQQEFLTSMRICFLVFCCLCIVGIGCSVGRMGKAIRN